MKLPRIIKDYHIYKYFLDCLDEFDDKINAGTNQQLMQLVNNEIGLSTCQFLKLGLDDNLEPHSSGVLVTIKNSYYILTASHVIEDWSDSSKLFVEIEGGHISVVGKGCGTEIDGIKIDVAYIKLKQAIIPLLMRRYKFLPVDRLLDHNKMVTEANYCVYGYPVQNRKIQDSKLKTFASAYWVKPAPDKVFKYFGFDFLSHYVLEFKGKASNIMTGIIEKIKTQHYGLSGGGLWYTRVGFDGTKLISEAKLIGIMIEFKRSKYDCLIANRLEPLLALIEANEDSSQ